MLLVTWREPAWRSICKHSYESCQTDNASEKTKDNVTAHFCEPVKTLVMICVISIYIYPNIKLKYMYPSAEEYVGFDQLIQPK